MNAYNWSEGQYIITFIVGSKYCVVASAYSDMDEVFEAVKAWAEEVAPEDSLVPFVPLNDCVVMSDVINFYIENELCQVNLT